ncbi:MAG: hypothetical protein KIT84_36190 [Labilithrix sp.]|nr:hypothetical protein [Labilithrix sp.]MCW5816495.1 hypothetical protein [Labilithrix sp.]
MSRAYLCVSIDTECDKGPQWRSQRPMAFEGVHVGIVERLQPLFASYGAKPTYLVSPEVIRDARSAEELTNIGAGCELGAHLHGEYAEPGAWEPEVTRDFQRDYEGDIEKRKLTYLTDQFIRTFQHQPVSFRAGRFGIGPRTIRILEDLGYSVESSVTPNVDWSKAGSPGLTFADAPTQPYRPDPDDPTRPGSSTILEIPITIRPRFLNLLPGIGKKLGPRWLRPTWTSGEALVRLAEDEIGEARRATPGRPVVLNAMLHNTEVIPDASPYADAEHDARAILDRLRVLLAFAQRESISVIGLGDVPEILGA